MQPREFVARRFQLHGCCVSREISDVGPVEHFHRFSCSGKSGGRESSPQSLKTHVCSGHAPVSGHLDDLHVVDAHHSFAVDIDQLFVEYVAREQHFTFATHERAQIEDVGIEPHAMLIQLGDAPAREKKIAAPITRDEARHGRMIVVAKTNDHVLHRRNTFTLQVSIGRFNT